MTSAIVRPRGTSRHGLSILLAAALAACSGAVNSPSPTQAPATSAQGSPSGLPSTAPPSAAPSMPDIAALGPLTLSILSDGEDDYTMKVDRGFEAKYPNVRVERQVKPFADLQSTAKLILSGSNVPDLIRIAQGLPFMGVVVKGELLRPIDDEAALYGWTDRVVPSLLALNRMTPDGARVGTGNLYGLSDGAEFLGVFYDKAKLAALGFQVPTTWEEFVAILAAAKRAGETPLMLGGLDKWMPPFVYEQVQSQFEDKDFTRSWVFNTTAESFVRPGNLEAATIFQQWATDGYFNDGFLGLPAEEAQKQFAGGKGLFFAQATGWTQPFQQQTKPGEIGFFVMPPRNGSLVTTGNLAVAYSIPSSAAHPEVAAAYLDYLISEESLANAAANGLLPAASFSASAQTSQLFEEVLAAWTKVQSADGFVPYLLNRSESMFTTLTERTQELLAGRITPEKFVEAIDADAKGSND